MNESQNPRPLILHARIVTGMGGGPEKTILNSPRFLRELGYDAICVYLYPHGDPGIESLRKRANEANAEFIAIPDRGVTDLSVIRKLASICRDRNVKIWHSHDYKTDALGLILRRLHSMKLVSTVHGWGVKSKKTPLYHAIDRFALRRYDRVICVSDLLYQECIKANVPISRTCEIANGIDQAYYAELDAKSTAQANWQIPGGDAFVFGAIGRLSVEKGFDDLIKATGQLIESGVNAHLVIAGEGPDHQRLQGLICGSDYSAQIQLVGHVQDPRKFFSGLDAFVISSHYEGLPNVLLESLACRVPTVTTAVGGIPTVVEDGREALLVAPKSVDALTLAMTRLAHNPALCEQLTEAGQATLRARFSFGVRMKKVAAVYDDLLELPAVPQRLIASNETGNCDGDVIEKLCVSSNSTHLDFDQADQDQPISAAANLATVPVIATGGTPATQPKSSVSADATTRARVQVETTTTPETWNSYLEQRGYAGFYQRPAWLKVLKQGMQHQAICVQALAEDRIVGVLPLALVKSRLFGRFLVSLPYLNSSGVVADDSNIAIQLVDHAIELADLTDVRYLELRHEKPVDHPRLSEAVTDKVHMRLALPATSEQLWDGLKSKVRSQIRKPLKNEAFEIAWGNEELLDEFYTIFARNMRDLGTPPFSRKLFAAMLSEFYGDAEFCVVRLDGQAVAAAILVHGPGVTEVPSASSLRQFNSSNANMLMYWHLLQRAIERGQHTFDFGRSSKDSGTFRFKSQWGAVPSPAVWQHYVRTGTATDMRPNSGKYDLMINAWQKLPVWLTKVIGPSIVRGIP